MPKTDNLIALDRASVRTYDKDGRLHVSRTPISKANVCPYFGREIPGSEELGLDPDKVYMLLRDPEELRKAAPTFNNIQLLYDHKPVSTADPGKDLVVGSLGSEAVFEHPYLYNSLAVWDKNAIDGVESNQQKELSSAYYYRADMTPGEFEGQPYDGVMRDIRGNHVALVVDGRAGSDVMVGDSAAGVKEFMQDGDTPAPDNPGGSGNSMEKNMSKKQYLTPKGAMAKGVLRAVLAPRLAQDKSIDLDPLLLEVKPSNWAASKKRIVAALASDKVAASFKDKVTQDEAVEEASKMLDTMDAETLGAEPAPEPGATGTKRDQILALIGVHLPPDDMEKVKSLLSTMSEDELELELPTDNEEAKKILGDLLAKLNGAAQDEDDEAKKKAAAAAAAKPMVDRAAMDAEIKAAVKRAEESTIARLQAIDEAKKLVQPLVGKLPAMDSAESIYRLALDQAGVDLEGVHSSAFKSMVSLLPRDGEKPNDAVTPRMGADAAVKASDEFAKLFPNAGSVRHV